MKFAATLGLLGLLLAPTDAAAGQDTWHGRALEEIKAALAEDRTSPRSFVALHRAWDLREGLGDDDRLARVFDEVAKDPRTHPLLRDHARWNRSALHTRHRQLKQSRDIMRSLGFAADLEVVGPFENLGDAGRDEPFGPEASKAADGPFAGVEGDVRWRPLRGLGALGRVDLGGLLPRSEDVVAYVRATVHAEAAREATVRLGSDDSYRLWVNGEVVGQFAGKRSAEFDQEALPIRLQPGPNTLLLKLSWTGSGGTFYLRVAEGPAWHPLTAWRATVEARGEDAAASDWATLGALHQIFGATDRSQERDAEAFRRALAAAPAGADRGRWFLDLGRSLGADENARRQAYEQAWAAAEQGLGDPAPAAAALARHYRHRGDAAKASAWTQRLARTAPEDPLVTLEQADRYEAAGSKRLALETLVQARRLRPGLPALHAREAALSADLRDRHGEVAALRRYLALEAAAGQHLRDLSQALLDAGDLEEGLAARRRILELWPHSLSDRLAVARLLAENRREEEALAEYRQLVEDFPESPGPEEAMGKLLMRLGRDGDGLAALERALVLRPQNRRLRRYLRHLKPHEDSLEDRYAVPLKDVLGESPPPAGQDLGAWTALDVSAVRVHANGLSSEFRQRVIRVEGKAQVDSWTTIPISFVPGQEIVEVLLAERVDDQGERHKPTRIRTVGPFGKSQGMYLNNKSRRIEFSDLRPGDTVHVRYRVDQIGGRNMFGDYYGDIVSLQRATPVKRKVQVYELPTERPLHFAGRDVGDPAITSLGARSVYRWEWADVAPHLREPKMPGYPEVGRFLSVSTYKDWGEMARWYAKLIKDQFELEEEDKALVRRLVEGATTVEERVARLHGYVVRNTRYVGIEFGIHGFKPYRAGRVLRRGYGDCKDKATLLSAMLAEVGIEGRVALVRTAGRGVLAPSPATLWAFNHAITYIPALDRWIDGTHEFAGSTELPYRDQGAMALVVARDGTGELTTTPVLPAATNSWRTEATGEALPDGSLRVRVREAVVGQGAESLRRAFQEASERTKKLEKMLSGHHPGVRVEAFQIDGVDDLEASPVLRFDALVPGMLDVDGDSASLPIVLYRSRLTERLTPGSERLHDLRLDYPWQEESETRLTLPEGWSVAAVPEDFTLVTAHGEATLTVSRIDRELLVRTRLRVHARRVPVGEYGALRSFAREVDRAEERRVRLVRDPVPLPAPGPSQP